MDEKIICVGSLNVDITLYVDEFTKEDEERSINELTTSSGGAAANVAAGIGKLGKKIYFFGNIGDDTNTSMLISDFEKDNVDYSLTVKNTTPNNTCYSIVDKSSERMMYAYNYVNFTESDFPSDYYNESLKYLIFTSLVDDKILEEYEKISSKAKENGTKIVFSPGNLFVKLGIDKIKGMISLSDYLILSETENKLLDTSISDLHNLCDIVIITKGKNGTELHKKGNPMKAYDTYLVDKAVDSTGAGDCYLAALISGLFEGKELEDAIKFAMKAAAISITKKGARGMPSMDEIENYK